MENKLLQHGIRPTANRILVLRALCHAERPVSLSDLETILDTIDKSGIFRTLTLFLEHGLVHSIEDGSGSLKYEICKGDAECSISDMHVHFYCDICHRTYCFEDRPVPQVDLPQGYQPRSVNYMVKGICPACKK